MDFIFAIRHAKDSIYSTSVEEIEAENLKHAQGKAMSMLRDGDAEEIVIFSQTRTLKKTVSIDIRDEAGAKLDSFGFNTIRD